MKQEKLDSKIKLSDNELVSQYIKNLPIDIQTSVEYLRQLILSIDNEISEYIKWNSPTFYYNGEIKPFNPKEYKRDILVLNLHKNKIRCVLPTGNTIKQNIEILEGNYTDGRRLICFNNLEDIISKESYLKKTIIEWLHLVEKN